MPRPADQVYAKRPPVPVRLPAPENLGPTVPAMWNKLYRQHYPPHLFLYADKAPEPRFERYPELFSAEDKMDRWSYKQLNASAYCLGAYMLSKQLKKGDVVLIISENRPIYAVFELGTQLMGAINLTIPADASTEQVAQVLLRHQPRFVCLSNYGLYVQHRSVLEQYNDRGEVLVRSLPHDELQFTDKLVTLEALEDQGKDYWREHQRVVNERVQSIGPNDPSTLMLDTELGLLANPKVLTHKQVLELVTQGCLALKPHTGKLVALLNSAPTWTLLYRVMALYAPYMCSAQVVHTAQLGEVPTANPAGHFMLGCGKPQQLSSIWQFAISTQHSKKGLKMKRLQKALALHLEKEQLAAKKQNLPFLKRRKWRANRRNVFGPLRKRHFHAIDGLMTHPVSLVPDNGQLFLRALGLPPVDVCPE